MATPRAPHSPTRAEPETGDALIARYVERHPHRPGPGDARIAGYGYSVWILIDALNAADQDVDRVANEYDMPSDAVRAATAFYEQHRDAIVVRMRANAADFGVYVSQ